MRNLPREFLLLVERVLREYPAQVRELQALDNAITAACHAPVYSEDGVRSENNSPSEPERIFEVKEQNPHYRWLEDHVVMVTEGVASLSDQEKEVIDLFCWQGLKGWEIAEMLKLDERRIWRVRVRALYALAPRFLPNIVRPEITD